MDAARCCACAMYFFRKRGCATAVILSDKRQQYTCLMNIQTWQAAACLQPFLTCKICISVYQELQSSISSQSKRSQGKYMCRFRCANWGMLSFGCDVDLSLLQALFMMSPETWSKYMWRHDESLREFDTHIDLALEYCGMLLQAACIVHIHTKDCNTLEVDPPF